MPQSILPPLTAPSLETHPPATAPAPATPVDPAIAILEPTPSPLEVHPADEPTADPAPRLARPKPDEPEAIVVGSGPNGLAAAITLARAGRCVWVYEAEDTIGGGTRSAELTLPGFIHDICSAVHPLAVSSPFFRDLELDDFGLQFIQPEAALAHPFDNGSAALLTPSLAETAEQFGEDARAVQALFLPLVRNWEKLSEDIFRPIHLPKNPFLVARFGLNAIRSAKHVAYSKFNGDKARAVFAGMAAHSVLPLDYAASANFGLVLWTMCHCGGWPFAGGGTQAITNALAAYFKQLGGEIFPARRIASLAELPNARAILLDISPRQFLQLGGDRIAASERRALEKFRHGPGIFKVDWALDAPIPWNAPQCSLAGTVHLGGTFEEIAESEKAAWDGVTSSRPCVILAQPSLFDPARAPQGKHTAWGYCHVPHGSAADMLQIIESQIERFAAGFQEKILARSVWFPRDVEKHNANLAGGDISGGAMTFSQLFFRPTRSLYSTSIPRVYLCSSSTPPGGGVHGMCGRMAAERALRECFS